MERLKLVQLHINDLTNNEDHRQELWLRHLEGEPLSSLEIILDQIQEEKKKTELLKEALWNVMNNPPSDKFAQILEKFTPLEQKVMLMLALGCDIDQISRYNRLSEVRLCQLISNLGQSKEWEKIYGPEEKLNRRRKIRSDA